MARTTEVPACALSGTAACAHKARPLNLCGRACGRTGVGTTAPPSRHRQGNQLRPLLVFCHIAGLSRLTGRTHSFLDQTPEPKGQVVRPTRLSNSARQYSGPYCLQARGNASPPLSQHR